MFDYVERRGRPYPLVPVTLRAREELTLYALVDSGAVVSLFPEDVANAIGLGDAEKDVRLAYAINLILAELRRWI